jgi:hypothetical protein
MFIKKKQWNRLFAILMAVLLVMNTYTPVANAKNSKATVGAEQLLNIENASAESDQPIDPPNAPKRETATPDSLVEVAKVPVGHESFRTQINNAEKQDVAIFSKGSVVKGSDPVASIVFSVHTVEETPKWYNLYTDENGDFTLSLPDGHYQLDGIWLDPTWYVLNKTFSILDGKLVGTTELLINVLEVVPPSQPTVKGVLQNGATLLADVNFSIHTLDGNNWYTTTTDHEGKFTFVIPDGQYQLDGIWRSDEWKWYELNQRFEVVNGQLVGGTVLAIDLKAPVKDFSFTGTLKKGSVPLSNIVFSIHTTTKPEQWYNVQTDENGNFQIDIPDGTYRLEGIWVSEEWKWYVLEKDFTINGKTELAIDLLAQENHNVTGTLKKGTVAVANTIFSVQNTETSGWYNIVSDEKGNFSLTLPKGPYRLEGVWIPAEHKWYELNQQFTVEDVLPLHIDVLSGTKAEQNVTGMLKNGTAPLANITFSIHTKTGDIQWYAATTDEFGAFAFTLPDGDYQVDGIWVPSEFVWYELYQPFSVSSGKLIGAEELQINIGDSANNVVGTVKDSTGAIKNAEVRMVRLDEYHHYELSTGEIGTFSLQLEDGTYEVYEISANDSVRSYHFIFTVKDGKILVDGKETSQLTLVVPDLSVQSVVYNGNGEVIQDTHSVYIESVEGDTIQYASSKIVDGKASFRLDDGDYTVVYISSKHFQNPVSLLFSVIDGEVFINGEQQEMLEIHLHPETLKGQLLEDGKVFPNTIISINKGSQPFGDLRTVYTTITDENGYFYFGLPDGVYTVQHIFVNDQSFQINLVFEMKNGKPSVDGTVQEVLTVSVAQFYPIHGKLESNGQSIVGTVSFQFENDPSSLMTRTDENGEFMIRLQDGSYRVGGIYEDGGSTEISLSFDIIEGSIYVNGIKKDRLNIEVPPITLVGNLLMDGFLNKRTMIKMMETTSRKFSHPITDDKGKLAARLPDGNYEILGVNPQGLNKYILHHQKFSIVGGKLVIAGSNEETLSIQIGKVSLIQGMIENSDVETFSNSYVYVRAEKGSIPNTNVVNENGSFTLALQDGKYTITHVTIKGDTFPMTLAFEIVDGKAFVDGIEQSELIIKILSLTLKGKIAFGDEPTQHVYVDVIDQKQNHYSTWSNAAGEFDLRLPDGEYQIREVYLELSRKWVSLQTVSSFSIINGKLVVSGQEQNELVIPLPSVSLKGKVNFGYEAANKKVYFDILNEKDFSKTYPLWTDSAGNFELSLPDGQYTILFVYPDELKKWLLVDPITFTITGGKLYINGVQQPLLPIEVPKTQSITGRVVENGVPLSGATVRIKKDDSMGTLPLTTDANGHFTGFFQDGLFSVVSVTVGGSRTDMVVPFEVRNGKVLVNGIEQALFVITLLPVTFQATVMDEEGILQRNNVGLLIFGGPDHIQFSSTNANGQISLRLKDGNYDIGIMEFYEAGNTKSIPYSLKFTIENGKMMINGVVKSSLTITIPKLNEIKVHFEKNGQPVMTGSISVSLLEGNTSKAHHFNDVNGNFTMNLQNGKFKITSYVIGEQNHFITPILFEVINGKLFVNGKEESILVIN